MRSRKQIASLTTNHSQIPIRNSSSPMTRSASPVYSRSTADPPPLSRGKRLDIECYCTQQPLYSCQSSNPCCFLFVITLSVVCMKLLMCEPHHLIESDDGDFPVKYRTLPCIVLLLAQSNILHFTAVAAVRVLRSRCKSD